MSETKQELAWRNRGYQDVMAGREAPDPTSTGWRRATASQKAAYRAGRRNARNRLERERQTA